MSLKPPALEADGVLVIDKPEGLSSAGVVRVLKRRLSPKKIGHGGTLDPFATGVLIVVLGKGTKLSPLFLEGDKRYSGTIRLGVGTATDDITGEVTAEDEFGSELSDEEKANLCSMLKERFSGDQQQVPPVYSALKVGGERSYRRARRGETFERAPRQISVYDLQLGFESSNTLRYSLHCSKGTYVRSLARDIGLALGTVACVETLRREESSGFSISEAVALDDLTAERVPGRLLSCEAILERLSRLSPGRVPAAAGFVHSRDLL